jgi:ubiquinol-cytochrome c reductase cytochrome b subunit
MSPKGPRPERLLTHRIARWIDTRLGAAKIARSALNKVFPDHWSFMIGELGLYCFIVLVLTGVYLTFFFDPSPREVIYTGSYEPLRGVQMSEAYRSGLELSFDVRAGLVMRQIHHWAALLFLASISVHLARVFFTGAFRRPREINWIAADPGPAERAVRVLAARRPALGHRAAHRVLGRTVDPARGDVGDVVVLRR